METLGERIKKLRLKHEMTQTFLGNYLGVTKSAISMYERNKSTPDDELKIKLAKLFGVSVDFLIGNKPEVMPAPPNNEGVKIPILGSVVAGIPVSAITDILGYEEITQQMAHNGKHFALRVKGDSMLPDLKEGDIVIVREQPDVESGSVAIVLINGDEATVKQVKKSKDGIVLFGYNTAVYEPHFYTNKEIEELPIQIIGKVVESRREW